MSQYLILIYGEEAAYEALDADAGERIMAGHREFGAKNADAIVGGHELQATGTATSLRVDDSGTVQVTDGPFAETKEALGGFYLIEAEDLAGATEIARQVPAPFGGLEIRPVLVF
jgi:hypothetical protein